MSAPAIESKVEALAAVLRGGKFFIPRYQRPYAWKPEHVKFLLEDIADCIAHRQPRHFLGTIMLVDSNADGRMEVNDGQQRIATFFLICANLCRHFHQSGNALGESETMRVLFDLSEAHGKTLADAGKEKPRLMLLSSVDKHTFEMLTCGHSVKRNGGMYFAWRAIEEFFARPEYQSDAAKREFLKFILNNVWVAWVRFKGSADSISVFETLNARGKSLEQIQLACTYFYSRLREDEVRSVYMQEQIDNIRSMLNNSEDQFFAYARCAAQCRYGYLSSDRFCRDIKRAVSGSYADHAGEVCAFVRNLSLRHRIHIFQTVTRMRSGEEFVERLVKDARAGNSRRNIRDYLTDLHKYGGVSHTVLFALLCRYADVDRSGPKREMAKFAHTAGKLLASFFQRAAHSYAGPFAPSHYEQGVARIAKSITGGNCQTPSDFLEVLRTLDKKGGIISDLQYRKRMESMAFHKLSVAKYILARINEHLQRELSVVAERSTTEHILPESKRHLPGWDFADEEHTLYVSRLGNLTLLAPKDNKPDDEDNANFAAKLPIYRESVYDITQRLADLSEWNVKSVERRSAKLAKLAAAVWNFNVS